MKNHPQQETGNVLTTWALCLMAVASVSMSTLYMMRANETYDAQPFVPTVEAPGPQQVIAQKQRDRTA